MSDWRARLLWRKANTKEDWPDGRDFISISPNHRLSRRIGGRTFWTRRIIAAAVFLGLVVFLSRQAWMPIPGQLHQLAVNLFTSGSSDWTPAIAQYFSQDSFEQHGFATSPETGNPDDSAGAASEEPPATTKENAVAAASPDLPVSTNPGPGPAAKAPKGFVAPVSAAVLRPFGDTVSTFDGQKSFHAGVDFATAAGVPVLAAFPGRVKACDAEGETFSIRITHEGGMETTYSHLGTLRVAESQEVKAGDQLATSAAGWVHFSVERDGQPLDPTSWFPAKDPLGPTGQVSH